VRCLRLRPTRGGTPPRRGTRTSGPGDAQARERAHTVGRPGCRKQLCRKPHCHWPPTGALVESRGELAALHTELGHEHSPHLVLREREHPRVDREHGTLRPQALDRERWLRVRHQHEMKLRRARRQSAARNRAEGPLFPSSCTSSRTSTRPSVSSSSSKWLKASAPAPDLRRGSAERHRRLRSGVGHVAGRQPVRATAVPATRRRGQLRTKPNRPSTHEPRRVSSSHTPHLQRPSSGGDRPHPRSAPRATHAGRRLQGAGEEEA
jgi:hypothetical protein